MNAVLLLALLGAGPVIEIATGPFMVEGNQAVYYQILGATGIVSVDRLNDRPTFEVRFLYRNRGKVDSIGIAHAVQFPIKTIQLRWLRSKDRRQRATILVMDETNSFWMVHCLEGKWVVERNPLSFFITLSRWL